MRQILSEDNSREIASWKRFSNNQKWQEIVDKLKIRLAKEEAIIFTPGTDDAKLARYSERDIAVISKKLIEDLIKYPEREIDALQGTFESPPDDDPYEDIAG